MKSKNVSAIRRVRAGLIGGVVAATTTLSAQAVDLPFSDSTGFSASATATVVQPGGGLPVAGRGGLEFSTPVLTPPGAPIGDGSVPLNIWQGVAWGCQLFTAPSAGTCANGGVISPNGTNFPDPIPNPDRSSLRVDGKAGLLTDAGWTDVTTVTHYNKIISDQSNLLRTVDILSKFRLGTGELPAGPITITFTETPNSAPCTVKPAPINFGTIAPPANPLGGLCDDFAIVSGIDLASVFVPAGALGNPGDLFVDFRLFATPGAGAIVCDGSATQPASCAGYNGSDIIVYTAENSTNSLALQARLRPVVRNIALFVIGDVEPHAIGNVVNFWGAQWWKNNFMSGLVSSGVASFKGYASSSDNVCGGTWTSRPGNSSVPPATIPDDVAIIVTDTVKKVGPNISGTIKQIVLVHHDGNYGPAPGHRGSGPVISILCTAP